MGMIDHWHPVALSSALRGKPLGVRLAGRELALFRPAPGKVACLDDVCPHRRMRLSQGQVIGGKLQCRYHGWAFDECGQGESPGTPKLHACAGNFEARESHGAIWVKPRGVHAPFPDFTPVADYFPMCALHHVAPAPLELTVDNFCEIEHTSTTHAMFGYRLEEMRDVRVQFETTDTTVRVVNHGPPKPFHWPIRRLMGVQSHYHFYDDWTTYFSPVYSIYNHWWADPKTGEEGMVRWKLYIFFCPIDDKSTHVMTFAFAKSRYPGPAGGLRLFRWLLRRNLSHEIDLDVNILAGLASHDPSIEGMKLSRFDKVLGLNRERIDRIYRGVQTPLHVYRESA